MLVWYYINKDLIGRNALKPVAATSESLTVFDDSAYHTEVRIGFIVSATGEEYNWKAFRKAVKNASSHHDVFINFPIGILHQLLIKDIRFVSKNDLFSF